jgi:hypothetical protein
VTEIRQRDLDVLVALQRVADGMPLPARWAVQDAIAALLARCPLVVEGRDPPDPVDDLEASW